MPEIPTIKIECKDNERGGFAIINESDFDHKTHTPFKGTKTPNDKSDVQAAQLKDEAPNDTAISDDQLRAAIETATGKKPHWKSSRETLLEQFHTINGV